MKAMTLHQPLAGLFADGTLWAYSSKWLTHYRGDVLIHGTDERAQGQLLAVADLTLCVSWDLVKRQALRTDRVGERLPGCSRTWGEIRNEPHHEDCHYVIVLEYLRPLAIQKACPGHSGLWECDFNALYLPAIPTGAA